jgi:branched-chain amino acid transport system permease protein
MLGRWRLSHILLSIVLLILIVLPVFASRFALLLSTEIFILSLFALSFYVLLGYGGMLSFGHAAYYGIGAYTCALLLTKAQLPVGLGILIAPLVASLSGIIIGWFCIRLTRLYFAMLTMAFSQLVWAVVFKSRFTGAGDGIVGIPAGSLIGPMTNYYYFVGIILMITFFLIRMLGKSPFGLALQASRDNYERTEFIGLNVKRHQLVTFTIGAFFAGLAGALFAIMNRAVFPDLLYWTNSGEVLVISLLGGVGTLYGPILGAAILTLLGKYIADYTIYWGFILGIILTIIVIFMPGGITGFVRKQLGGRL